LGHPIGAPIRICFVQILRETSSSEESRGSRRRAPSCATAVLLSVNDLGFGWLKAIVLMRKVRHRGVFRVDWIFTFACPAYNLVRLRNLTAVVPAV